MPVGWFIAPYVRRTHPALKVVRSVVVDDLTAAINASANGGWSETEVLGNHAVVKVRATNAVLTQVANLPGVQRIPVAALDGALSTLSTNQKNAIRNKVQALGYSLAELQERFPNDLGTYTLRDLLHFVARRRRKVRYDEATDTIIDDGEVVTPRPLAEVDVEVP